MLTLITSRNFWIIQTKKIQNIAQCGIKSSGMWQNAENIICDDKDREYLRKIRKSIKI